MRRIALSEFPEIAKDFNATLNEGLIAEKIGKSDMRDLQWECSSCKTIWTAKVRNRLKGQEACPKCRIAEVLEAENLQRNCPELAETWSPSINDGLTASEVRVSDFSNLYNWTCGKKGHIYGATVGDKVRSFNRYKSLACPVCLNRVLVPGVNDLASQSPAIAAEWATNQNAPLTPGDVTVGDTAKVHWICPLGHEWMGAIGKRAQEGLNCSVCAGKEVLEGFNDFASQRPLEAREWDYALNEKSPNAVTLWSNKTANWVCAQSHRWPSKISKRAAGQGCPICKNKQLVVGFNDLKSRFPLLAEEFDEKENGIAADQVLAGDSTTKYVWLCSFGHSWKSLAISRQRTGCPDCAPLGFKPSKPARLYFIENRGLAARKIGITNLESKELRLGKFAAAGWNLIHTIEFQTGHEILALEKRCLKWIRNDCGLPQYLGAEEMKSTGGWTETFSEEGPSNLDIVRKIKDIWTQIVS